MKLPSKIFLIGMPGCGKSTLGRSLAEELGLPFIDLDREVESMAEKSIKEIFAEDGEARFRDLESKQLAQCIQQSSAYIMATGGGTPCFFDNLELIKASGLVVFLNVPPQILSQRLIEGKGIEDRPLLSKVKSGALTEELTSKLEERLPYYSQAHTTIDGDEITMAEVGREVTRLSPHL